MDRVPAAIGLPSPSGGQHVTLGVESAPRLAPAMPVAALRSREFAVFLPQELFLKFHQLLV
jgi:hypothetical protein